MAIRCGCPAQGDAIVFGELHECDGRSAGNLQAELDRLEREDPAVAKASAGLDAVYRNVGGGLPLAQVRNIYDLDRPYETSLDEGERTGD